jgi:hypothetical protein
MASQSELDHPPAFTVFWTFCEPISAFVSRRPDVGELSIGSEAEQGVSSECGWFHMSSAEPVLPKEPQFEISASAVGEGALRSPRDRGEIESRTVRKLQLRPLPFLFVLYVVAFIDRINVGFAALTMNKEMD